jgi:hypothetical protein
MGIFGFGSKLPGKITKVSVKNEDEVNKITNALKAASDTEGKVKVLKTGINNNSNNPELVKLIADMRRNTPMGKAVTELRTTYPNDPTVELINKAQSYVPPEPKTIRINTDKGVKDFILKDLSKEDANSILRLFGEKKLLNKNLGLSVGNVNTYMPDEVIDVYNQVRQTPEVLELLAGKPFNRDLAGKIAYNIIASGLWGSTGSDAAQVANRFSGNSENGNPDDIWTNSNVVGLAAALTRGAVPLIKPIAKLFGNAKALSMVTDLGVPFVGAKVLKHATTPSTDQDATNATDATNTDALKDIKFKNNWN